MGNRVRIKDLPQSQRPMEKLSERGAENLTDSELVAILLGTGTRTKNALMLANTFLKHYPVQSLSALSQVGSKRVPGIGKVKMMRLLASFELGKRIFTRNHLDRTEVVTSEDILDQVRDIIPKKQEYLVVLYINARFQLLQRETVAIGKVNVLGVEPKELFAPAFSLPCYGIIIVHNHPSGEATPSDEDIRFTANVQKAGELLGIPVLDHIVVSQKQYFSFKENRIGALR